MINKFFKIRAKKKGAFTLIELLVLLSILLVLILIAVPALRFFQRNSNVTVAAEEIVNILRLAQSKTLASENSSQYGVYFETSTPPNKYTLFKGQTYALRSTSSDEIHNIPNSIIISALDLGGGAEVVFERVTGHALLSSSYGTISLISDNGLSGYVYVESSGLVRLDEPATSSDEGRISDSRHVHFNYNRVISTSTEKIILDFSTVAEEIPIAANMQGEDFFWQGTVNVDGSNQVLKIHTLGMNMPDTNFCIHRDLRYNNKAMTVTIDGDPSGSLIYYDAFGQVFRGTSVNLTIGAAGDPQKQ